MAVRARRPWVLLALMLLSLLGCTSGRQVIEARLSPEDESGELRVLEPPMDAASIEALAAGFDWADTTALPELDEEGHPALWYATVLLRDRENLDELRSLDLMCDALPLLDEERSRWDGQTGIFDFPGSAAGDVAFCILPAGVYDLFRQLALDGSPLFDAVELREVPAEARLPGGSIAYDWAAAQGFRYGESVEEAEAMAAGDAGVGGASGMLFGRIRRSARRLVRDVVNGVRRGLSAARQRLGGSHEFSLRLFVHNTDAAFDTSGLLRQHWGSRGGDPVWVDGLPVQVASGVLVSLDEKKTDDQGFVRMRIPRARRVRVYLRLQNRAADMIGLVWEKRILVFHGSVDRNAGLHLNADVQSGAMNILAQLTDARHFTRDVLHYHSPRRLRARSHPRSRAMPAALVRTGAIAGRVFPNAVTPCLGTFGFGTISLGSGRGYSVLANVLSVLDEADMYFPDDTSRTSRVVPTHEYGHFVMCRMLADQGGRAFGRAWGELIGDSLAQDGPRDGQAGILGEAWADFFASQVAGGTDYFGLSGSFATPAGQAYCDVNVTPVAIPCLDDNVGAPVGSGAYPHGQFTPSAAIGDARTTSIARWATLLTDAADGALGPDDTFNNGVSWRQGLVSGPGGPLPFPSYQFGQSAHDEAVQLPGEGLAETIADWALTSRHLHFAPFANSLARVMLLEGASETEVCELFALHTSSLRCDELIDTTSLADRVTPSTPRALTLRSRLASAAGRPEVDLSWVDVSPLAADFETHAAGPGVDQTHTVTYARTATDTFTTLPFDAPLGFSVATRIDGRPGGAATAMLQSPPQPVGTLSATALAGGVRLSWAPVDATSYVLRELMPTSGEIGSVYAPLAELHGLAGDADYEFQVISVNATGERSAFPSPLVTVHTLPAPIIYVSTLRGDDTDSFGGTPSRPFATLARALREASPGRRTTVRLAAGDYAEPHLNLSGLDLVIEGGYAEDPSDWRAGAGSTTVTAALGPSSVSPPVAPRFDASSGDPSRGLLSSIEIGAEAQVRIAHLQLSSAEAPGSGCRAVLASNGADLTLDGAVVRGLGTAPCSLGVVARASDDRVLEIRNSRLWGSQPTAGFGPSTIAAALVSQAFANVTVTDSSLVGLSAPGASGPLTQASGWVDDGSTSLRASRASFSATDLGAGRPSSGVTAGVDARVESSAFFDNVVADAPGGAWETEALRIEGLSSEGASVQLAWLTARVGDDFSPATLPSTTGTLSAAVALAGRIRRMMLANNLLVFANWGSFSDHAAALDLSGLATGPEAVAQLGSEFSHNVLSFPPAGPFGQAAGPLILCDARGEFSTLVSDEMGLNDPSNLLCRSGGAAVAANNLALVRNPGAGLGSERDAVVLTADGHVDTTATGAGTLALLRGGGAPLAPPWPVADLSTDRGGAARAPTNPGVGAWIIP